ncbi:MAG: hypothetical protein JXR60_10335 [Bacteroidales bacterium]|nr:hypothetical protein [Bacteroidales bacterium]
MEIENSKGLYKVLRVELIGIIVFGGSFPISFLDVYTNKYLPLKDFHYALIILVTFIIAGIIWFGLKHSYISFNDEGSQYIFKYFRITPKFIKPKPKMVKIPKESLYKYTIESSFFGLRKALFLFQKTPKGVVKYPPIFLTTLKNEEIQRLENALK